MSACTWQKVELFLVVNAQHCLTRRFVKREIGLCLTGMLSYKGEMYDESRQHTRHCKSASLIRKDGGESSSVGP